MPFPSSRLPSRRLVLAAGATLLALPRVTGAQGPVSIDVWKDPNCGCCGEWIRHLQAHGMQVRVFDTGNVAMRQRLGIAPTYGSCHTAMVGGYAIEGHVPAREILRLLKEKPKAIGLAVPGMPIGSPGMDGPEYKGRQDPYEVLLLLEGGGSRVFQRYG